MASVLPSPNPCCLGCDSQEIEIEESESPNGWFAPQTLAALRAIPTASTNVLAEVQGGDAYNDGLGGRYYWMNAALNADDGMLWIKPNDRTNAQAGRWNKTG